MNFDLELCLAGSLIALLFVLWLTWRLEKTTVGLPLCYLISLGSIHFVGAWIYTFPVFEGRASLLVGLGFRECLFGVLAFVGGVLVAERVLRRGNRRAVSVSGNGDASTPGAEISNGAIPIATPPHKVYRGKPVSARLAGEEPSIQLPEKYILLGVLFIAVFIPLLSAIPSFGAAAFCGAYLIVAGICLGCQRAWSGGHRWQLLFWLAFAQGAPVFTMLALGNIYYGASVTMIIFSFVLVFFRPRWQGALFLLVATYMGLSVFVTYMRDRETLRGVVWGKEEYSKRITAFVDIFRDFEWFNPNNELHLLRIDDRLNQNALVGMAVVNLDLGIVPHAKGETVWQAAQSVVPRFIWPDKPVRAGSPEIVSHYTGIEFEEGTSVGVGQVMEFYINFGRWGVVLGFFCFGAFVRLLDWQAASRLARGDGRGFCLWFLPGLSFLQVGGSLIEVTGSAAASTILVLVVNRFVANDGGSSRGRPRPSRMQGEPSSRKRRQRRQDTGRQPGPQASPPMAVP